MNESETEIFAGLRPLLFSIAYRMLASVSEAEDIVQESFLRYQRALADGAAISSPRAYLSATVTRLAIDEKRSARSRRETYVGEWLPEPLLTGELCDEAERADSLSMAFLLVLQSLNPVERAVFLLHDVFSYDYEEIAGIVGKSAGNCRQLALRARGRLAAGRPRFESSPEKREQLAAQFFAALAAGDLAGLTRVLAADVVSYGDGGGKAPQWAGPIVGADRVARLFAGLGRRMAEIGVVVQACAINGQPGAKVLAADGGLINVLVLDIADGQVRAVRSVINPDKIRHLGPVADLRALAGDRSRSSH